LAHPPRCRILTWPKTRAHQLSFTAKKSAIRAQADVKVVPASSELFRRGCQLHAQRQDKEWSLTDCTSFVVMKERAVEGALTSDHHFEQAGFRLLMQGA